MKLFLLSALLLSSNAFACWNIKAVLSVNSKEVLVDQKIEHDKTYSFPTGPYIFHVKVPTGKRAAGHLINVSVVERKGLTLSQVSTAELIAETGKEVLMTQLDQETQQQTSIKLTLTEI